MTKEVTKKESNELTVSMDEMMNCGAEEVSSSDIVIPKLMLMQKMSKMVDNDEAKEGEFRNSLTKDLMKQPLKIVPILCKKVWYCKKKVNGDFEFSHVEAVNAENENRKWDDVIDGVEWKYVKSYNFYCLVDGEPLPLIVGMGGNKHQAKTAKQLVTQMMVLNKMAKLPPFGMVCELSTHKEKGDKGSYFVYDLKATERASDNQLQEAYQWFTTLKTSDIQEDNSDLEQRESQDQF